MKYDRNGDVCGQQTLLRISRESNAAALKPEPNAIIWQNIAVISRLVPGNTSFPVSITTTTTTTHINIHTYTYSATQLYQHRHKQQLRLFPMSLWPLHSILSLARSLYLSLCKKQRGK